MAIWCCGWNAGAFAGLVPRFIAAVRDYPEKGFCAELVIGVVFPLIGIAMTAYFIRIVWKHLRPCYEVRLLGGVLKEGERATFEYEFKGDADDVRRVEFATALEESRVRTGTLGAPSGVLNDSRKSVLEKSSGLGDIGAMAFMGLFGVVGFAIIVAGLWMTLSFLRGNNGAPLSFERRILKRSHADLAALGLFAVVWNVFSWSFVLGFVGEEQVRRLEPRLLVLAIFPLVGLFLIGVLLWKIVRALRAPRLVLTLSCAMWKQGSPAQVDWSLENPEEIESLEIALARMRMKGSGKQRRLTTVSSQSCCHRAQSMAHGAGSFDFTVPGSVGDGCNLSFVAKVKVKSIRRVFTFSYPLPSPVA
jgi:hypothetical protein